MNPYTVVFRSNPGPGERDLCSATTGLRFDLAVIHAGWDDLSPNFLEWLRVLRSRTSSPGAARVRLEIT